LLFRLEPESAHRVATSGLRIGCALPGARALARSLWEVRSPRLEQTVAGIRFPAPLGLAAGFDKRGDLFPALSSCGFGFVEVGTFTRVRQQGNPRPRVFRFGAERALVNRLGFNNPGAEEAARTLDRTLRRRVPRGVSVGRSRAVEPEAAIDDQVATLRILAAGAGRADYWALNVSSPNTPGLRAQQEADALQRLLDAARAVVAQPIFLKLDPDLEDHRFDALVEAIAELPVAALILTNTTVARAPGSRMEGVAGGLSGAPLFERSTALVRRAYRRVGKRLPIVGVGGIFDGPGALAKIRAGASLLQTYTGYIFEGPGLPRRVHRHLDSACRLAGCSLADLVGSEPEGRRP
jgi:dihydroorotate dehydrogenase